MKDKASKSFVSVVSGVGLHVHFDDFTVTLPN